ncbi:MAG: hypothetical protein A2992_09260 [Elusimicrobia bacterium RIFCSPLOWO2_01_FULL_59_12]|nr:MAG: hypothetical protein A2992_09260 [Elusimicrobia bacterium RIFCSPLOWO2_01_FULL_59_12]
MQEDPPHLFHIPVMGTGFTIDTPLKVARYGISSVISLVDDDLIEQMRKYHSQASGEGYDEISDRDEDHRARRITAYLNLLHRLIERQVSALQAAPFEPGSELTLYYEMLPEGPRKEAYREMLQTADVEERARRQAELRRLPAPGTIDVNIMTKLDRDVYRAGEKLGPEQGDAMAALRGFARSDLRSSVVFSAGMNSRLYSYAAQFSDFLPDGEGRLKKKIILKVSDFRSAAIQGKFLAKRGLWVSEYRIESGLNCGGHAFPTDGLLLGPILEEFRTKREALAEELFAICNAALLARGRPSFAAAPRHRVTAQGGIGTAQEQELLLAYYRADATGWGTPFLLVPEVTHVDEAHLRKLIAATEEDVRLSDCSPLGIPFWSLTNSASEAARRRRIEEGRPGSPCPKAYLALNTEFTPVPICPASQAYQRLKLRQLAEATMTEDERALAREGALRKACICHDLAGGATVKNDIDPAATTAVCPGPNIVNFKRIVTLREMVGHIYGRLSILANRERPHMFIAELKLYADYLREESRKVSLQCSARAREYLTLFKANLLAGISHYQRMADHLAGQKARFLEDLHRLRLEIEAIEIPSCTPTLSNPA